VHQTRQDATMPAPLQRQARQFIGWIGILAKTPGRLEGTPFHRLAFKPKWVRFTKRLLRGDSDRDMATALAISTACADSWRRRFTAALAQRHPDLCSWWVWQLTRRYYQVSQFTRQVSTACFFATPLTKSSYAPQEVGSDHGPIGFDDRLRLDGRQQ